MVIIINTINKIVFNFSPEQFYNTFHWCSFTVVATCDCFDVRKAALICFSMCVHGVQLIDGKTTDSLTTFATSTLVAFIVTEKTKRCFAMEYDSFLNHNNANHINLPDHNKLVHHCTNTLSLN